MKEKIKTIKKVKKEGRRDEQGSQRDEPLQEKRGRFEGGCVQSSEVHGSPEQTLANREAVVRVRVGQREGTAAPGCKMWQIYFRLQAQEPFPALNQVSGSGVKDRTAVAKAPYKVD